MTRNSTRRIATEEGAVLPLMMFLIVVLLGFAAFAVDLGIEWNQRRQAQTSADAGVLAGGWEMGGDVTVVRDTVQAYVRRNLDTTYADGDWVALWATCVDADRPAGFTAVPGTDCISIDAGSGLLRVRVPTQTSPSVFSAVFGVTELNVSASAVARVNQAGVRPFAMPAGAGTGEHCLQQPPGGHAELPCDGPEDGNFSSLFSPRYSQGCPGNKNDALVLNIVRGIDHDLSSWDTGDPYVLDGCPNLYPNRVETDTGFFPKEITEALITGSPLLGAGDVPVLQRGEFATRNVIISGTSYSLDNRPLWRYLLPNSTSGCQPGDFAGLSGRPATDQMTTCLQNWTSGELFDASIMYSPRLMVIPQFVESSLPSGTSEPRTIASFRAVFIDAIGFKDVVFYPGESGSVNADNNTIIQTTSFNLPNTPMFASRLDTSVDGRLRSFTVELIG